MFNANWIISFQVRSELVTLAYITFGTGQSDYFWDKSYWRIYPRDGERYVWVLCLNQRMNHMKHSCCLYKNHVLYTFILRGINVAVSKYTKVKLKAQWIIYLLFRLKKQYIMRDISITDSQLGDTDNNNASLFFGPQKIWILNLSLISLQSNE